MSDKIFLMRPYINNRELEAIKNVLDSRFLTEGPVTEEFEKKFAEYSDAKYGIATTSCSTALELALRTLNIGKGDEVIVPDFTYPVTSFVVSLVGATPILVDVDIKSYNTTVDRIEEAITKETKVIMPVSIFGNPLDREIYELKEKHDIHVVEDAACTAGAMLNDKKIGSQADITCFSFHPRKVITTGEGGMLTTNNEELGERARSLKKFGMRNIDGQTRFAEVGTNYKLSNILATIGLVQLEKIEEILKDRQEKANSYSELLEEIEGIQPPEVRPDTRHTFQSYACYIEKEGMRDRLREELAKENIETQIGTYALHLEPAFNETRQIGNLENSEKLFYSLITLPLHHELTQEEQLLICERISFLLKNRQSE